MQTMNQMNAGITELTDAQLDGVVGGCWLTDALHAIGSAIVSAARFIVSGFMPGGAPF